MTASSTVLDAPRARPALHLGSWAWLGVLPFFAYIFLFLLYPSSTLVIGSFQDDAGHFTLQNFVGLNNPFILGAYQVSLSMSLITALIGGVFGFLISYATIRGGVPSFVRSSIMTFCGVASNFAGIPLAFAFIATIGRTGLLIQFLKSIGIDPYGAGFTLYSFWGLSLAYIYFQFPLMVLIIVPAIDGLRTEWQEATQSLGGSSFHYWRWVALPILAPAILGSMVLLFGNAFGAYATAYALTGGGLSLVTIRIGDQLSGDAGGVSLGVGYAMAIGMVAIMAVSVAGYTFLQRQTERWLK